MTGFWQALSTAGQYLQWSVTWPILSDWV